MHDFLVKWLISDNASIHEGEKATLTATSSYEAEGVTYSYQWYRDGMLLEGETNDTLVVFAEGSYSVKVKANDGIRESCEAESDLLAINRKRKNR